MKFVNTINGPRSVEDLEKLTLLPHEHLFQNLSRLSTSNIPITMQSLSHLQAYPLQSALNTILNDPIETAHELSSQPLVVCESTSEQNGLDVEKLKKVQLIRIMRSQVVSYRYQIPQFKRDEQSIILHSRENIIRKIELELSLGVVKPAFFGELVLSQLDLSDEIVNNYFECFCYLSNRFHIPIMIDIEYNQQIILDQIRSKALQYPDAVWIICNPFIQIEEQNDECSLQLRITNKKEIYDLLQNNTYLIFDRHTFKEQRLMGRFMDSLKASDRGGQVFLSPGVRYKTHLTKYGGLGYAQCDNNGQLLGVMGWVREEIKVKEVKLWNCPICHIDYDDGIERFKKMDQEFCSIKCLREWVKANK